MMIDVVEPHQVKAIWPHIAKHVRASQARSATQSTSDLIRYHCMTDESWRLVVLNETEAAAVIRVWDTRLHVVAIAGKLPKGWEREFFDWLSRCGRFMGLTSVTLGGRKGWIRKLAPLGFVPIDTVYIGAPIS